MYRSKILNRIKLDYFLKFVVHELNSEMVVLTERELMLMGCSLEDAACC
jgi:hypothetical protein